MNGVLVGLFCWLTFFVIPKSALAKNLRPKVVFTDWRDEDVHALIHLLEDPEIAATIRAIYPTGGNTVLKSTSVRRLVHGIGRRIPVVAGTSSESSESDSMPFPRAWDSESAFLLPPELPPQFERFESTDGLAVSHFSRLLRRHRGVPIDVVNLAPPTDLVKTIDNNPALAEQKLGTLYTVSSEISADTPEAALARHIDEGVFRRIYQLPEAMIRHSSGLANGRLTRSPDHQTLQVKLDMAAEWHPALGPLFDEVNPSFGDLLVADLAKRGEVELKNTPYRWREVQNPVSGESENAESTHAPRHVREVLHVDATHVVEAYLEGLMQVRHEKPLRFFHRRPGLPGRCRVLLKRF